jgi:hypothetical protein
MNAVRHAIVLLAAASALSACGARKDLKPTEGMKPVPVARGADRPDTPAELMTPDTQSRPDRNAEPLIKSQERQEDPFDLPPN